jgi:hypothetical protein
MPNTAYGSKLLIAEPPLQVLPSLACALGLNEALLLQQVHYWLAQPSAKIRDGRPWLYNSYADWQHQFPFWSISTIRRTIETLEQRGLLRSGNYNSSPMDRTKWYTIDYAVLDALSVTPPARFADSHRPSAHSEQTGGSERAADLLNVSKPIPETTFPEINPREGETAPPPPVEQFEPRAADTAWFGVEARAAGVPSTVIDVSRETATWRDMIATGERPRPRDPAADWRIWMRRAIRYAQQHPELGGSPAPGTLEHRARRITADDAAADAAAQQLIADLDALAGPGRGSA